MQYIHSYSLANTHGHGNFQDNNFPQRTFALRVDDARQSSDKHAHKQEGLHCADCHSQNESESCFPVEPRPVYVCVARHARVTNYACAHSGRGGSLMCTNWKAEMAASEEFSKEIKPEVQAGRGRKSKNMFKHLLSRTDQESQREYRIQGTCVTDYISIGGEEFFTTLRS